MSNGLQDQGNDSFSTENGIFENTKLDPTIINGGIINSIKSTAKLGKSDWSILEADESDGSFTHISPTYSIITNIDREHMDFYKSMKDLKNHFLHFIKKVPSFGKSFICTDDKINNELSKDIKNKDFWVSAAKIITGLADRWVLHIVGLGLEIIFRQNAL